MASTAAPRPPAVLLRRVPADSAAEVAELYDILAACGADMASRLGLRHWDPPYPNGAADLASQAAAGRALWAVVRAADGAVVGTVTTGDACNVPYLTALAAARGDLWADAHARAVYVAKLALRPGVQGGGLGAAALAAVEAHARAGGATALRLDALRAVPNLPPLYRRAGFSWRAEVSAVDAHGTEHALDVWEKVLS